LVYASTKYVDGTTAAPESERNMAWCSIVAKEPPKVTRVVGTSEDLFEKETKEHMVTVALFVRLEAKPGKEAAVAEFLRGALPLAQKEPATNPWFAVQMGPSSFAIFDAFPDDAGRETHLSGPIGAALKERASELFAQPPTIEKLNVLAAKTSQQK
jgi:quinol monooxygenase YgiN